MKLIFSKFWKSAAMRAYLLTIRAHGQLDEVRAAQLVLKALYRRRKEAGENSDDTNICITAGSVKPGEPAQATITAYGVVINEAEGATLHHVDGSATLFRVDGTREIRSPNVRRIEAHDLSLISGIKVVEAFGTASHVFEFWGGGRFSFATGKEGEIIEIHAQNVDYRQDQENGVMTVYGTPRTAPSTS